MQLILVFSQKGWPNTQMEGYKSLRTLPIQVSSVAVIWYKRCGTGKPLNKAFQRSPQEQPHYQLIYNKPKVESYLWATKHSLINVSMRFIRPRNFVANCSVCRFLLQFARLTRTSSEFLWSSLRFTPKLRLQP